MIHRDTRLMLSPLTVFVGPNGTGKSAIFDALVNFSMLSRGFLRQAFGPYPYSYRATLFRGAGFGERISFSIEISQSENSADSLSYDIEYYQSGMSDTIPQFTIQNERLYKLPEQRVLFDRSNPSRYPLSATLRLENERTLFSALRQKHLNGETISDDAIVSDSAIQISRFNKFRLDPTVLAQPSRLPESLFEEEGTTFSPRIGYRGEDLATTLYHLSDTNAPELDMIRNRFREIDSSFRDFEFNTVGTDRIAFSILYSDHRESIPALRLSAGTLIYLGLIVLVSSPNRPPILMIEEPENGLAPHAIKSFYAAVKSLAFNENMNNRSQVLISSHSPYIICEAWNGQDRDFIHQVKNTNGVASIRKFSDVLAQDGVQLGIDPDTGLRTHLGLRAAEQVMSGIYG